MTKRLLYGLILIALMILVLLMNTKGTIDLNIGFDIKDVPKAVMLFIFTGLGVVIGILIK